MNPSLAPSMKMRRMSNSLMSRQQQQQHQQQQQQSQQQQEIQHDLEEGAEKHSLLLLSNTPNDAFFRRPSLTATTPMPAANALGRGPSGSSLLLDFEESLSTDSLLTATTNRQRRQRRRLDACLAAVYSCSCWRCIGRFLRGQSLRSQLLKSFGLVTVLSLGFVMIVALVTTYQARDAVLQVGSRNFDLYYREAVPQLTRLMADVATKKYESLEGLTLLVQSMTQERFMGYPDTLNDTHVPFRNHYYSYNNNQNGTQQQQQQQQHVYPLRAKNLLPLDTQEQQQLVPNVFANDAAAAREHIRKRHGWYFDGNDLGILHHNVTALSTVDATFFAPPRVCDPLVMDRTAAFYCRDNDNAIKTAALQTIYEKASDFVSPLFKALYEYHGEVKSLGIHFVNDGRGVAVEFPGRYRSERGNSSTYTSIGCDWMNRPNPKRPGSPIGTAAQIAKCHEAGTAVSHSEENALEQEWCRDQVLEPDQMHLWGPDYDQDGFWHFGVGRAVFDAVTNQLLACTRVQVSVEAFLHTDNLILDGYDAYFGVVRWDDIGTILNATSWEPDPVQRTKTGLIEVDMFQVSKELLESMKSRFVDSFETNGYLRDEIYVNHNFYGGLHPAPIPKEGDKHFRPQFLVYFSTSFSIVDTLVAEVDEGIMGVVGDLVVFILCTGFGGMVVIAMAIYVASLYLTSPLQWMNEMGNQIIASAGTPHAHNLSQSTHGKPERKGSKPGKEGPQRTESMKKETKKEEGDKQPPQQHPVLQLENKPWSYRLSLRSEITQLVDEFHTMVKHFSGSGTAKVIKQDLVEVKNPFRLGNNFKRLYKERARHCCIPAELDTTMSVSNDSHLLTNSFGSSLSTMHLADELSERTPRRALMGDDRKHWGPNIHCVYDDQATNRGRVPSSIVTTTTTKRQDVLKSPIFWWILSLVAMPVALCMIAISVYVTVTISDSMVSLGQPLEDTYMEALSLAFLPYSLLRASYASNSISIALRDLYVSNRMAGWLFNGAIPMSNTLTEMTTSAEDCKHYPVGVACPAHQEICSCEWNDPRSNSCDARSSQESRFLQQLFFEGLREDAMPNGDRDFTSYPQNGLYYPQYGVSPSSTFFWDTIESLPGAEKGYNASGYETTFDRVRTASALSAILIPLFNYVQGTTLERSLSSELTFDADGMTTGYAGCSIDHVHGAHYRAQDDQSGFCPEGKFGYDGRCEDFYVQGKEVAQSADQTSPLLLTTPRTDSKIMNNTLLSRGILPLMDSRSDHLIGLSTARFSLQDFQDRLDSTTMGPKTFKLLSHSGRDATHRDTFYVDDSQTGKRFHAEPVSLAEVVLPHDRCESVFSYNRSCEHLLNFNRAAEAMHRGASFLTQVSRTTASGEENLRLNFGPVLLTTLRPWDESDFSRGVREYQIPVFTVTFGITEEGLRETFTSAEADMDRTLRTGFAIMIASVAAVFAILAAVSWFVAMSVAIPVAELYNAVSDINRSDFNKDFPELEGGSSEVTKVRATFEKLHRLLRAANSAFFMGHLKKAYETLHDALALFEKVDNSKAIGIANNNLGNVMLTMYRTMLKMSVSAFGGMSREQVIRRGCHYFKRSIDSGEEALARINNEEGWSEAYLIFMQQLSNRYFNRAIFLLTVCKDHPDADEAENQGYTDLSTCKDMDREVVDSGETVGFKGDANVQFELLLGRIKGLLLLMKMGYDDEWGIDELLDEAQSTLLSAFRIRNNNRHAMESDLFRDLEPAGQMQRLEGVWIEYYGLMSRRRGGDDPLSEAERSSTKTSSDHGGALCDTVAAYKAASFGIRMLVEDDYVIGDAALLALRALGDVLSSSSSTTTASLANTTRTDDDDDERQEEEDYSHNEQQQQHGFVTSNNNSNALPLLEGGEDPSDVRSKLFRYRHEISEALALSYTGRDILSRESFTAANLGDFSMEAL